MDRVHSIPVYRSMNYIKLGPFESRWRAQMNRRETFSSALIWAIGVKMNGEGDMLATSGGVLLQVAAPSTTTLVKVEKGATMLGSVWVQEGK
jgi:hypothetical protein